MNDHLMPPLASSQVEGVDIDAVHSNPRWNGKAPEADFLAWWTYERERESYLLAHPCATPEQIEAHVRATAEKLGL